MAFIPANIGGGESSTPITPSNSNPAALTANTSVKPTTNGYAIASYDSVTPSSTPESVASGDIVKIGGSGVIVDAIPTPTSITPSNTTPVALTADAPVTPTTAGYAIESYNTKTPSNATPAYLVSGEIDKMGGTGYAIESYTALSNLQISVSAGDMLRANGAGKVAMLQQLTPSNTSPPSIDYIGGYYAAPTSGYVISSYSSVTPSSTPTSVSAGNMIQINGSGVIVDAIPTPTQLLPSNSSPAAITNGGLYQASASGYAISSYSSKTPSDTSPASVSSGAIIKASSAGYLYKTGLPILGQQPNAEFSNNTAGTSGSVDITVTQKPRYIIMSISSRTSAYLHQMGVIDVTGAKAWRMGCNADGTYSENWSNYTTYFTTISASKVTYSYAAANYNKRVVIQIYY